MNVTFSCPQCDRCARVESPDDVQLTCPHCAGRLSLPDGALVDGQVRRCLVCPNTELFVRKDFPQRLGVAIVVLGCVLSCVTWYAHMVKETFGILFSTALVDVVLYTLMGNVLTCYRCQAEYREVEGLDRHEAFNLETYERYRQQAARTVQRPAAAMPKPDAKL